MDNITTFLGEPVSYWIELQRRAETLDCVKLISEIADLYSKVGFYERRIKELSEFMNRNE